MDESGRRNPAHGVHIDLGVPTIVFLTVCSKDRAGWLADEKAHRVACRMAGSRCVAGGTLCADAGSCASFLYATGFGCSAGRMGPFLEEPFSAVHAGKGLALAVASLGYEIATGGELCGEVGVCAAKSGASGVGERG